MKVSHPINFTEPLPRHFSLLWLYLRTVMRTFVCLLASLSFVSLPVVSQELAEGQVNVIATRLAEGARRRYACLALLTSISTSHIILSM